MSKEKYARILVEMSTPIIMDIAATHYPVKHMIDTDTFRSKAHYTMSVAHYIGRLQRQQQGYDL